MEKTQFDRSQDILASSKSKLQQDIAQLKKDIQNLENKDRKFQKFLLTKHKEIKETKKKIKNLAHIEEQSKTQIDQNIEMLTWLIESINDGVAELKNNMIQNSENAIKESLIDFQKFVKDLTEIIIPLGECKKIQKIELLNKKTNRIAETLDIFSSNIDETIESMTDIIKKANKVAVNESSKEFDAFIEDVHQIFETFNTVLQKLKLTNSTKKYLALEEIYIESNTIIDKISNNKEKIELLDIQQQIKVINLEEIENFGLERDISTLKKSLLFFQKKKSSLQEKIHKKTNLQDALLEKVDFIQDEKETIRAWFEALTDEVVENQNQAADTYNILYATLDSIHSSISFIKADLQHSSESAIRTILDEFNKSIKKFSKIVDIIKKIENITDYTKKQNSIALIYKKSKSHIKIIQSIINKIAQEVKIANINAVIDSFKEFDYFIEIFKSKFYIIQEAVSTITLSSSSKLIQDLENLSENQINSRIELSDLQLKIQSHQMLLEKLDNKIKGIENNLKIYSHDDTKRRKVIHYTKKIDYSGTPITQRVNWSIKNEGIVPYSNFNFNDLLPLKFTESHQTQAIDNIQFKNSRKILTWHFNKLNKRENISIDYLQRGFTPLTLIKSTYQRNISTKKLFMYKNLAQPISLKMVEENGKGAIILKNTGNKDIIWNIILNFKETTNISEIPNVKILRLNPQEIFIKNYEYSVAESLKPDMFQAQTKHSVEIRKERSIDSDKQYKCDIFFKNNSEFLMNLSSLSVYDPNEFENPLNFIRERDLEVIRPNLDFAQNFLLFTEKDPPEFVVDYHFTLHLVYEYITDKSILLKSLIQTPKLIYSEKSDYKLQKTLLEKEDFTKIHPELIRIDDEIALIFKKINKFEDEIKILRNLMKKKEKEKEEMTLQINKEIEETERIEKEKLVQQMKYQKKQKEELQIIKKEQEKIDKLKKNIVAKKKSSQKKKSTKKVTIIKKKIAPKKKSIKKAAVTKKSSLQKKKSTKKVSIIKKKITPKKKSIKKKQH